MSPDHPTPDPDTEPACWSALRPWLPAGLAWRCLRIEAAEGLVERLPPEEAEAIARAVPRRRHEFAAGRWCARMALADLGRAPVAVPVGERRAPVWPQGVVGTISHDDAWSIAAVALRANLMGLGVDIERLDRFDLAMEPQILVESERGAGPDGALDDAGRRLRLAISFAAKEAAFKALYPMVGEWIGFEDAELIEHRAGAAGPFRLRLLRALGRWPAGMVLTGASALAEGRVASVLALPATVRASPAD